MKTLEAGKPIGVGIIGLSANGGWGKTAHVPAIQALPEDFRITGLVGSSPDSAAAAAAAHGVPFSTDSARELSERPDVDLLVVAVKVPRHRELIEAIAPSGKPIYCEWPLARDLAEAEALNTLAGDRGFVGLQGRSAPTYKYVRQLLADGFVGEVLSTNIVASTGPVPWGGQTYSMSAYLNRAENGATMQTIPFGHTTGVLTWLLGGFDRVAATMAIRTNPIQVVDTGETMETDVADHIAVSGILQNGAVATMHYRGPLTRGENFRWEINGREGDLVLTGGVGHAQYGAVQIAGARGDAKLEVMPVPAEFTEVGTDFGSPAYAVSHVYKALARELRGERGQLPTFADAVANHRLLDAITRSAQSGNGERV